MNNNHGREFLSLFRPRKKSSHFPRLSWILYKFSYQGWFFFRFYGCFYLIIFKDWEQSKCSSTAACYNGKLPEKHSPVHTAVFKISVKVFNFIIHNRQVLKV